MNEAEGSALLRARFTEAGYAIAPDFHFHEGAIEVDLDGWDAALRVGFEYITREAGDSQQFTPEALAEFEARMGRGELFVLLIDEGDAVTADELDRAARAFLGEVAARRAGG